MDNYTPTTSRNLEGNATFNYHPIGLAMIDSSRFESAATIVNSKLEEVAYLWAPFVYHGMITQINGIAGVGKSTLMYNIAVNAALGGVFADVPFSKQLNVLYADLETSRTLRKMKLERLLRGNPAPDNLWFTKEMKFPRDVAECKAFIVSFGIDLFIVDTRNELFNTEDEDNNSEAQQQYECLKYLRDETGVAIVDNGHIGKSGKESRSHGVYAGRGASSRACTVDVVCNLLEDGEGILCLSKEKDKVYDGKEKLYLRKAGQDAFEVVDKGDIEGVRQGEKAKLLCLKVIKDETTLADLLSHALNEGISVPTLYRMLAELTRDGLIEKPRKGVYKVKKKSSPQLSITPSLRDDSLTVDDHPEVA